MTPETATATPSRNHGSHLGETPRSYAACLRSYNAGTLHGRWIDAAQDPEDIQREIAEMLRASPEPGAEEHAIHDYEGFGPITLHEYDSIERVARLAAFIEERGDLGAAVLSHFCNDIDAADAAFDDYAGEHESLADFAQNLTEQTTDIPETLANYIDYAAMARDMEAGGDVFAVETDPFSVHVFWTR